MQHLIARAICAIIAAGVCVSPTRADDTRLSACAAAPDPVATCARAVDNTSVDRIELLALHRRFVQAGRFRAALGLMQAGSRRFPGHRDVLQALIATRSLARDGGDLQRSAPPDAACFADDPTVALTACRRALEHAPNGRLFARLGDVHRALGQPHQARQAYRSALSQDPSQTVWRARLRAIERLTDRQAPDLHVAAVDTAPARSIALVIANNKHRYLPDLVSPHRDGQAVAQVLREAFGMQTHLLLDGTREAILAALAHWRVALRPVDEFLLYYAGHGYLDPVTDRGYWLPVDAREQAVDRWIANDDIAAALRALPSARAIVIADSCFSGSLIEHSDRERHRPQSAPAETKTRRLLSSGHLEPVLDTRDGRHSEFAKALIAALRAATDPLPGRELTRRVKQTLEAEHADTTLPRYGAMLQAGHSSGEFFFRPRMADPHLELSPFERGSRSLTTQN